MLRVSKVTLRVSAFSVFLKDLSQKGKKVSSVKAASKLYRGLDDVERAALEKRASRMSYPALDAFNRFQKEHAHRFTHLPMKQRQRKVAALWKELKTKGTVKLPKAKKQIKKKAVKAKKPTKAKKSATKTTQKKKVKSSMLRKIKKKK